MTLLKTESFDAISAIAQRMPSAGGSLDTSGKRTGRACWTNSGGPSFCSYIVAPGDAHATFILGCAINRENASAMQTWIQINGSSNTINHLTLQIFNDGSANLRLGGTTGTIIATVPLGTFKPGWEHIQIKAVCADAGGTVEVRLNAATTPIISYTGDTRNGGATGTYDAIGMSSTGSGSPVLLVDDLYVCNGAGSDNNDFLGDLQIIALLPNAEGDVIQFTPSTSTIHYALVDEAPLTSTDYNTGTTDGNRDLLNFANLVPTSGTIVGITRYTNALKVGTEVKYIRDVLRIGGVDYEGASKVLTTSQAYYEALYPKNPAPPGTAAWTIADINALQAGSVVKDT